MNQELIDKIAKLEDHIGKLQFLLDEGIDMMLRLSESNNKMRKFIEEHKYFVTGLPQYNQSREDYDLKLWESLEDE